jgi:general secretion pathway protein N
MILSRGVRTRAALAWRFAAALAAAAILAAMLVAAPEQFGAAEPVSAPMPAGHRDETATEPSAARNAEYPAIAAYPLFYPTRRPWKPPPPEPPAAPIASPSPLTAYTLIGVVVSGNMRSALVRAQASKVLTLSEGEEIDGWTLKSITPERLLFTANEATYEMTARKPSEIQQ